LNEKCSTFLLSVRKKRRIGTWADNIRRIFV
jgi:hypothetical protein